MSKAPSMPMMWDAYLADTTHLSTEEHGAYLLLLGAMWRRNGWVPDDDKDNARITGLSIAKYRKFKDRALQTIDGFVEKDGLLTQGKLLRTYQEVIQKIEKNRENGSKGGRKKREPEPNDYKDLGQANGSDWVNPNPTIPEPHPKESKDSYYFLEWEGWFSESDVFNLERIHSWTDVRKKVSERSFYDWAVKTDSQNPKKIATNWFTSRLQKHIAEESLNNRLQIVNGGKS